MQKTIKVFFSWQSDSPIDTNRKFLRAMLNYASTDAGGALNNAVEIDEATDRVPGSPNIAKTILDKIDRADIFVADITTITPSGAPKPCPNPNVTFELGYAVRALGWDRIILMFNSEHGAFPKDLPFDIAQHRCTKYNTKTNPAMTHKSQTQLINVLSKAICLVANSAPLRPGALNPTTVRRDRDVRNLKQFLNQFDTDAVQVASRDFLDKIEDRFIYYHIGVNAVTADVTFELYDTTMMSHVRDLRNAWSTLLNYDRFYRELNNPFIFGRIARPHGISEKEIEEFQSIASLAMNTLATALSEIVRLVRTEYIEIDIDETNMIARQNYSKHRTKLTQDLE